jgi:hypothetical protein
VTDIFKLLGARNGETPVAKNANGGVGRLPTPSEVLKMGGPPPAPEPIKDPARQAAMNFVRQMRIAAR